MIKPKCVKCNKELNDYGAILLSSPNEKGEVKKYHICKDCYEDVLSIVKPKKRKYPEWVIGSGRRVS